MHDPVLGTDLPSSLALAYLGDAEYSLRVRRMLVGRGYGRAGDLNRLSLFYVTAKKQAEVMEMLAPHLSEEEKDVARRAANSPHLGKPKHASIADYRRATALEAVFGMLSWLGDEERIKELFAFVESEEIADDQKD